MMRDAHYIALIHKDADSGYGVSFPDVPGVIAVADTLDDAIAEAASVLDFAFEDWPGEQPVARTLEALRLDPDFQLAAADAVVAAIRPSAQYYQAAE
ncbi:HicB_like antitoxin of toxin-antitoxin system [Devosia sp. YR412]|uniref:type II toxin-antitoxin system HicB family antitoxin n=1 Tax=Devosia sp. YR412 TaxID=1881030 RepID=UPI0008B6A934|nr:type II toxin-antitoxin system HicB family antitoxin [Devosia sp. YR412]SEP62542.1 HicB_like antitoxin of toxin-antitoxin system [Devosia sp. YR412]